MENSTSSVGEVLTNTTPLSTETDFNRLNKPTETVSTESSNGAGFWNDSLYSQIPDLVNDRFRSWYCDAFYKLGRERTLAIVKEARADGKHPARYFSYLLKEAINAKST